MPTTPQTARLMELAQSYVDSTAYPDLVCVYAGGSVGRGRADDFSDLDLMFWHGDAAGDQLQAANIEYDREILQVHHAQLPALDLLQTHPWDNRFIEDGAPVYDPNGVYARLHRAFLDFIDSPQGRDLLVAQAREIVATRQQWTRTCLGKGHFHTGAMAAMAAWTDAAFLLGYLDAGSTSTGDPLANLADYPQLRRQIETNCPVQPLQDPTELNQRAQAVRAYRHYLGEGLQHPFALDPLQDDLMWRKVSRLRQHPDPIRSAHELYHQTYWLVLMAFDGSLEGHLQMLPPQLAADLQGLGFAALGKKQIEHLLEVADQIVDRAPLTS
ncbi:MAG: hypothetical protein GKR89_13110 [Candidatus Latescibacteria bacterium]|nr:hypothetical protein [Candidatus Latescibacterota bacterium]